MTEENSTIPSPAQADAARIAVEETAIVVVEPTKKCTDCGIEKPLYAFAKHIHARDGRNTICKACVSEQARIDREFEFAQDMEGKVAWAINRIAENGFFPLKTEPGKDAKWPGIEPIREALKKQFDIDTRKANTVIDRAVEQLYSADEPDSRVKRRLLLAQIELIASKLLVQMTRPRIKRFYKMEKGKKVLDRIEKSDTFSAALQKQWLEIQVLRCKLLGIDKTPTGGSFLQDLLNAANKAASSGMKTDDLPGATLAHKIRQAKPEQLSSVGHQIVKKPVEAELIYRKALPQKSNGNGNGTNP